MKDVGRSCMAQPLAGINRLSRFAVHGQPTLLPFIEHRDQLLMQTLKFLPPLPDLFHLAAQARLHGRTTAVTVSTVVHDFPDLFEGQIQTAQQANLGEILDHAHIKEPVSTGAA